MRAKFIIKWQTLFSRQLMVTHVSKTLNAWILFCKTWMATENCYYMLLFLQRYVQPQWISTENFKVIWKQPPRGVPIERCSENMQQITGEHSCRSVISIKFLLLRTPLGGCFWLYHCCIFHYYLSFIFLSFKYQF